MPRAWMEPPHLPTETLGGVCARAAGKIVFSGAARHANEAAGAGYSVDSRGRQCRVGSRAPWGLTRQIKWRIENGAGLDLRTAPDWLQRPTCQPRPRTEDVLCDVTGRER